MDTVTSIVYAEATIDNVPIDLSYEWNVETPAGDEVIPIYTNNDTIKWVPAKEGDYTISVTGSTNDESVTKTSFLTFNNTIKTFQTALKGEWKGFAEATFFQLGPRVVHFSIESNGHYSGYVSYPAISLRVLDNGNDSADDPEKKFVVNDILANGEGTGTIKFVHHNGSVLTYLFDRMQFSNDYNEVTFYSGHFEASKLRIEYKLIKQN